MKTIATVATDSVVRYHVLEEENKKLKRTVLWDKIFAVISVIALGVLAYFIINFYSATVIRIDKLEDHNQRLEIFIKTNGLATKWYENNPK